MSGEKLNDIKFISGTGTASTLGERIQDEQEMRLNPDENIVQDKKPETLTPEQMTARISRLKGVVNIFVQYFNDIRSQSNPSTHTVAMKKLFSSLDVLTLINSNAYASLIDNQSQS